MNTAVSRFRRWVSKVIDVLFFICCLCLLFLALHVFVIVSFKVPSNSMRPTLLPGDYIWVEKCSAGARLFDVNAALDREEVHIHRLPGWRKFGRNDVVVFNFPYQPTYGDSIVFDIMKYYVKRIVAIPGDTLRIENGYYRIGGQAGLSTGYLPAQEQIAALPDSGVMGIVTGTFPWRHELKWNIKQFGPLHIPARGESVRMDSIAWMLYQRLIEYEQHCRPTIDGQGHVWLGDSLIDEYCFRKNYYFVAGDNAYNSQDSRYWGMLPEEFIVGRVWRIWKSIEPSSDEIRWNRIFKKIE